MVKLDVCWILTNQWGYLDGTTTDWDTTVNGRKVTFPIAFGSSLYSVAGMADALATAGAELFAYGNASKTAVSIIMHMNNSGGYAPKGYWLAIGK